MLASVQYSTMDDAMTVWVLSMLKIEGLVYPFLYNPISCVTFGPGRSRTPCGKIQSGIDTTSLLVYLDDLLDRHTVRGDAYEFEGTVFTNREALFTAVCVELSIPDPSEVEILASTEEG